MYATTSNNHQAFGPEPMNGPDHKSKRKPKRKLQRQKTPRRHDKRDAWGSDVGFDSRFSGDL